MAITNTFAFREIFMKVTMGLSAAALFTMTRNIQFWANILDFNFFGTEFFKVSNLLVFGLVAGIIFLHKKNYHG